MQQNSLSSSGISPGTVTASFRAQKSDPYGDNGAVELNSAREYRGEQYEQQGDGIMTWNGTQSKQPNRSLLLSPSFNYFLGYMRRIGRRQKGEGASVWGRVRELTDVCAIL